MKILKNILTAVGVILVIAFAGIYFLPNTYTLTETIEINRPAPLVYRQVCNYQQWAAWSPWEQLEPKCVQAYEGQPGSAGHKMVWDGKKIGKGTLTILQATANKAIESEIKFIKPYKSTAKDKWLFEDKGAVTQVTWISEGPLHYPFGRIMGLSIDQMLGNPKKQGLQQLKEFCEGLPLDTEVAEATP